MGLLGRIKEFFGRRKEGKKSMKAAKERAAQYLQMSVDDLRGLSDEELFDAISGRTEHHVSAFEKWEDGVSALNDSQKIFYAVNWLDMEVNNGGLCQFFVNSSRLVAPWVSEYMGIIGADAHKKLYDDFMRKNKIDPNDLASFAITDAEEFEKQNERYPFDEYDQAFFDLEPLQTFLTNYAKAHLEDF